MRISRAAHQERIKAGNAALLLPSLCAGRRLGFPARNRLGDAFIRLTRRINAKRRAGCARAAARTAIATRGTSDAIQSAWARSAAPCSRSCRQGAASQCRQTPGPPRSTRIDSRRGGGTRTGSSRWSARRKSPVASVGRVGLSRKSCGIFARNSRAAPGAVRWNVPRPFTRRTEGRRSLPGGESGQTESSALERTAARWAVTGQART